MLVAQNSLGSVCPVPLTVRGSFTFFDYTCLDAECAPPTLYFTTGLLENDDCQNGLKFSITLPAKPSCEAEKTNLTQCLADAGCDVGGLPMARELRGPKVHQRSVLRLLPRVLREGALRALSLFGRGQPVPDSITIREPR